MIEIPSVFFIRLGRLLRAESKKSINILRRGRVRRSLIIMLELV